MLRRRLPSPKFKEPAVGPAADLAGVVPAGVVLAGVLAAVSALRLPACAADTPAADAAFDKPFSVPKVEAGDPTAPLYVRENAPALPVVRKESGAAQPADVDGSSRRIKMLTYFAAGAAVVSWVLIGLLLREVRSLRAMLAEMRK